MEKEVKLFDPKFVHFMWDNSLEGKKGFFDDDIETLENEVNTSAPSAYSCKKNTYYNKGKYPFRSTISHNWKFFYYDPNYSVKWAYYKEGKKIQVAYEETDNWVDSDEPEWVDGCRYRVKPECPCDDGIDSKACAGCPQDEARKDRDKDKCVNKHYVLRYPTQKESDFVLCYEFGSCAYCPFYGEEQKKNETQYYRPFKDCDELVEFWSKHYQTGMRPAHTKPLIWVRLKCDGRERLIVAFGKGFGTDFVEIGNKAKAVTLQKLFEDYEFLDGSVIGVEE